ncbi:hypothetical protein [Streptomyces sp. NPDC018031]|uniref:hypothetical protein n=1 Tax=Streptomyces sp. NPDC018031 TaxID=3365033 RepID=UPI0037B4D921
MVLDASGVTFADSTFLNLLLVTRHAGTLHGRVSTRLQRLGEITGVDDLLEIRGTIDDAAVS